MNALITFNFNDFLRRKSRESMMDAAARWGCDFVEWTDQYLGADGVPLHPWWQRIMLYEDVSRGYDRVITIDGDVLVRSDCPDIFDLVPLDHFGAVSWRQPGVPPGWAPDKSLDMYSEMLGLRRPPTDLCINCGMIVWTPLAHLPIIRKLQSCGPVVGWKSDGDSDQTILSILLHHHSVKTTWLSWEYNAMRAAHRPRKMNAYVYHFCSTEEKPYYYYLNKCQWRIQ